MIRIWESNVGNLALNIYKAFGIRKQPPSENPQGSFGIPYEQGSKKEKYRQDVEDIADFEMAPKFHPLFDLTLSDAPEIKNYLKRNNLTMGQLSDPSSNISAEDLRTHGENMMSILRSKALQSRNPETGRRTFGTGRRGPAMGSRLARGGTENIPENYPETLDWPGVNYPTQEDLEAIQKPRTLEEYEENLKNPTWSPKKEGEEPYDVESIQEKHFNQPSDLTLGDSPLALVMKPSLLAEAFEDWLWGTDVVPELRSEDKNPSTEDLWEIFLYDANLEDFPDNAIEEAKKHLSDSDNDEEWKLPDEDVNDPTINPDERDWLLNNWYERYLMPNFLMGRNPPKYIRNLINKFVEESPEFKGIIESEANDFPRWWKNREPQQKSFMLSLYKAFGIRKARKITRNLYSVATNYGDFKKHFKTPRGAMAYAIKHARQGNTNHAHIEHPQQGGINRLSLHPQTGNLTLHHVAHGEDENALMRTDDPWKVGDLAGRDTLALKRMQHLHKNSLLSLGGTSMDINTEALYDLPKELHTTNKARDMNNE